MGELLPTLEYWALRAPGSIPATKGVHVYMLMLTTKIGYGV